MVDKLVSYFLLVEFGRKGLNTTKLIFISILCNDLLTTGLEKENSLVNILSPTAHWGLGLQPCLPFSHRGL